MNSAVVNFSSQEDNKKIMVEMGLCKPGKEIDFCKNSAVGTYKCAVQTRYKNLFCDLCLEEELLSLKSLGIHLAASCCGHGNIKNASILVVSENSVGKMLEFGYKKVKWAHENKRQAMFKPKTKMMYE